MISYQKNNSLPFILLWPSLIRVCPVLGGDDAFKSFGLLCKLWAPITSQYLIYYHSFVFFIYRVLSSIFYTVVDLKKNKNIYLLNFLYLIIIWIHASLPDLSPRHHCVAPAFTAIRIDSIMVQWYNKGLFARICVRWCGPGKCVRCRDYCTRSVFAGSCLFWPRSQSEGLYWTRRTGPLASVQPDERRRLDNNEGIYLMLYLFCSTISLKHTQLLIMCNFDLHERIVSVSW